jgi:hypothetical protein
MQMQGAGSFIDKLEDRTTEHSVHARAATRRINTTAPEQSLTTLLNMSGAASLSDVTLRPWPAPKKDELKPADLRLQVDQLTIERGHLRNITEKSLQEDIIAGKDASSSEADEEEAKKDKKEVRSRAQTQEDIIRMQQEMCSEMEYEPWTNILQSLY